MAEIEHNAPRFQYRVYFKRDIQGVEYEYRDISDWRQSEVTIPDQPTYERYLIKVVAMNELGVADVAPQEVIGYSGEDGKYLLHLFLIYD